MKHSVTTLLLKYKLYILAMLKPLGVWGAFVIAFLDSSSIPVPMDIVIAGYVWSDKRHFYVYCLLGALGSAFGGLVPFFLGRAGGELFLLKRVDRVRFEQVRDRFERQEFLAMLIPSMLPPPTPWKAFVFGAGVFEMKTLNFMLAVFCGRLIHYLLLAFLTIRYGPEMVHLVGDLARRHLPALLGVLSLLLGLLLLYCVRKYLGRRKTNGSDDSLEDGSQAKD